MNAQSNSEHPTLVFFDGECVLCNEIVHWLYRNDRRRRLRYATLHSVTAAQYLDATAQPESIVVVEGMHLYRHSRAVVQILWRLGRLWWAVGWLLYLVPQCVRDSAYRFIARKRYGWFGRAEHCFMPTGEDRRLFLP